MPNFDHCFALRCGLCTFELRAEDRVVACSPDGIQVKNFSYERRCHSCEHPNGIIPTFHEECHKKVGTPFPEQLAVTCCDFDPSPNQSITDDIAVFNNLSIHINKPSSCLSSRLATLPPELRLLVIKYVMQCWCTISTWSLNASTRLDAEVDLSCKIWACFVKIYARSYIASLSNENANEHKEKLWGPGKRVVQVLVFDPASAQGLNAIYIARDAWGVRNIVFSCLDDEPDVTESPGVWWQILRISSKVGKLITQNDVFVPNSSDNSMH
ncbi:hypothetical protein ED733_000045 [Metarhizium rileyi]|uniref:Uncharacterized protein n=1 Tax=Metarhizium rileyi (strain RCEF 4871) TaxID=1649241 RepID=A0A5C6G6Q4_METRR|nr:hypothetical protein ED733_000045 [Metarhizium rileyi]